MITWVGYNPRPFIILLSKSSKLHFLTCLQLLPFLGTLSYPVPYLNYYLIPSATVTGGQQTLHSHCQFVAQPLRNSASPFLSSLCPCTDSRLPYLGLTAHIPNPQVSMSCLSGCVGVSPALEGCRLVCCRHTLPAASSRGGLRTPQHRQQQKQQQQQVSGIHRSTSAWWGQAPHCSSPAWARAPHPDPASTQRGTAGARSGSRGPPRLPDS